MMMMSLISSVIRKGLYRIKIHRTTAFGLSMEMREKGHRETTQRIRQYSYALSISRTRLNRHTRTKYARVGGDVERRDRWKSYL